MPGPPPKSPDRRQRHNPRTTTERSGVGLVALPSAALKPSPPAGVLKATRDAWVVFWASPLASLVTEADVPALERLFELRDERARALKGIRRERLVVGGNKQAALNPLFAAMKGLDSEIRQLEAHFGLTPLSRLRLGATFGEAAKSLEELNRSLDDDAEQELDPRLGVVDAAAETS